GVFVVASGLPSPVTDARELAHQNHWGSESSASPSAYAGVDPLCARTTPTRAEGRRPLRLSVCQAPNGCGEISVRLVLAKSQQARTLLQRIINGRWNPPHPDTVSFGIPTDLSAGEYLTRNMEFMYALTQSRHVPFRGFLQPIVGF